MEKDVQKFEHYTILKSEFRYDKNKYIYYFLNKQLIHRSAKKCNSLYNRWCGGVTKAHVGWCAAFAERGCVVASLKGTCVAPRH